MRISTKANRDRKTKNHRGIRACWDVNAGRNPHFFGGMAFGG
jgi:hypothetical protein